MRVERQFFDLKEIKAIPITDVCRALGIQIKGRSNDGLWCAIRNERTPSCKIYTDTNTFCDFGNAKKGGDVISFVAEVNDCDAATAISFLGNTFCVQPETFNKSGKELTEKEYLSIGIYADLATKNFNIDIGKYSIEHTQVFVQKFNMSVWELKSRHPKIYHNMLRDRSIPYIHKLKMDYYNECLSCLQSATSIFGADEAALPELENTAKRINFLSRLLCKAITDPKILLYKPTNLYPATDIKLIENGKLSFEIGGISYVELKTQASKKHKKIAYQNFSLEAYNQAKAELENTVHTAFFKANSVVTAKLE